MKKIGIVCSKCRWNFYPAMCPTNHSASQQLHSVHELTKIGPSSATGRSKDRNILCCCKKCITTMFICSIRNSWIWYSNVAMRLYSINVYEFLLTSVCMIHNPNSHYGHCNSHCYKSQSTHNTSHDGSNIRGGGFWIEETVSQSPQLWHQNTAIDLHVV